MAPGVTNPAGRSCWNNIQHFQQNFHLALLTQHQLHSRNGMNHYCCHFRDVRNVSYCQQVWFFAQKFSVITCSFGWTSTLTMFDDCSLSHDLVNLSLGLSIFILPTNAEALGMMEKRFELNAYLLEGREAQPVNKGNVQISHFSHQSATRFISPETNYTR